MKLSEFRNLFDIHEKNGELFEFVSYMSQVLLEHEEGNIPLPVEFGNSQFHALSNLTEDVISYEDWVDLFETIQNSIQEEWDITTYNNLIKIYCSSHGFKYVSQKYDFIDFINEHISEMERQGFKLKLRTFLPIFNIFF